MDPWHPQDPGLSKYHTNDLFRAVEACRIPVTEFKVVVRKNLYYQGYHQFTPVTLIRHRISKSFFGVMRLPGYVDVFDTRQQIGGMRTEEQEFDSTSSRPYLTRSRQQQKRWKDVLSEIRPWVKGIEQFLVKAVEYERTPDLWNELYQARKYFSGQQEQRFDATLFTVAEQAEVSNQIGQIKAYIRAEHRLTREQISRVEAMLKHAEEASSRMNRKDWLILFYGAVSSLVLADLITPQTAQHVFLLTIHGLSHLFGFGGLPPQLPPAR